MKIAIVGGSGFIGRNLAKALHRAGEEVIIFSRKNSLPQELMGLANIHLVSTSKPSAKDLEGVDALVNLAGESVVGEKWSDKALCRLGERSNACKSDGCAHHIS